MGQILISSVAAQNPPVLLPPKSVCQPLSARTADGEASPFPASAGSKGINTLDFPAENRVPTGMLLAPIGNPEPRGISPLDTPLFLTAMVFKPSKWFGLIAVKNIKSEKSFYYVLAFSDLPI